MSAKRDPNDPQINGHNRDTSHPPSLAEHAM